jgi:hypothetical protein
VIDVKGQDWGEDCASHGGSAADGVIATEPEAILYEPAVIWRVKLADVQASGTGADPLGRNPFSRGMRYILDARGDRQGEYGVTVITDEMLWVAPIDHTSTWIQLLICTGMGPGIGMWGASQRPAAVYRNWFSEAIWAISFRLQNARDRNTLAADLGIPCDVLGKLRPAEPGVRGGDFVVYRQGEDAWRGPFFGG